MSWSLADCTCERCLRRRAEEKRADRPFTESDPWGYREHLDRFPNFVPRAPQLELRYRDDLTADDDQDRALPFHSWRSLFNLPPLDYAALSPLQLLQLASGDHAATSTNSQSATSPDPQPQPQPQPQPAHGLTDDTLAFAQDLQALLNLTPTSEALTPLARQWDLFQEQVARLYTVLGGSRHIGAYTPDFAAVSQAALMVAARLTLLTARVALDNPPPDPSPDADTWQEG